MLFKSVVNILSKDGVREYENNIKYIAEETI